MLRTVGVRLARTIQLTWMLLWRCYFFGWLLISRFIGEIWPSEGQLPQMIKILFIISFVLTFICGVSVRAFPIVRLLLQVIPAVRRSGLPGPIALLPTWQGIPARVKARNIASGEYARKMLNRRDRRERKNPLRRLERIDKPSGPGVMTGFEPVALSGVAAPEGDLVLGTPGAGLHSSEFTQGRIKAGVKGEETFAKALVKAGLDTKFLTMWSVKIPHPRFNTDVDCVLFADDIIFLIDIKYYRSGDVTYKSTVDEIYCVDNATGMAVGEPKSMSQNMKMAKSIFSKRVDVPLAAVVVFVPTDNGQPQVEDVVWPGRVPAMTLTEFLKMLKHQNRYIETSQAGIDRGAFSGQVS